MAKHLNTKNVLLAVSGSSILAFGYYNIHSISSVTEGGILGLTLLLQHHFGISPSISALVLNLLCFAFGARVLGRDFILYSIIAAVTYSCVYALCEQFSPVYPEIAELPMLAALTGAVFVGVGAGLSVRAGGATSGDDALAMGLQRLTGLGIQWLYLIFDLIVLVLSLTYIPLKMIAYSVLTVFISGQIVGYVQSFKLKKSSE